MQMRKETYKKYVDARAPKSPLLKDCLRAFLVGGLIWLTGLNWIPFAAMILIVTGSLIYFLLRLRRS